jgi:hypothetical protein
VKSYGPDASTLAPSLREEAQATETRKPDRLASRLALRATASGG